MGSLSEINLPNQLLSISVAAGLVAFAFMILRISFNGFKSIVGMIQRSQSKRNKGN